MEPIYYNSTDIGADYDAYLRDGYDAGPLIYIEDPYNPNFFNTVANPMWENNTPYIIMFSDFLAWYSNIDYRATLNRMFVQGRIGVGKVQRYMKIGTQYIASDVKIKKTLLVRKDETSFYHDIIVIARINAIYKGDIKQISEWYRFRIVRSVENDLNGNLQVSIYNPRDNAKGIMLQESLAPDIPYEYMDAAANEMLSKYYEKALRYPCRVNAYELADNMGFSVQEACLSEDLRIRSRIVFEDSEIMMMNPIRGEMTPRSVKGNTILIDPVANRGDKYNFTEDSIIHECVHGYWHRPFQKLQSIHREKTAIAGLASDLETILNEGYEREELQVIEHQARGLTPRIRIPALQSTELWKEYLSENEMRYHNHGMAVEKTISQMAFFYGTSKTAMCYRMKGLGQKDTNGVLVYCNGRYLPRHAWSQTLKPGESYSIEREMLETVTDHNPMLKTFLSYEIFVYVEGFVCLNEPEYITFGRQGRKLTPRALKDVSKCCLKFTIHTNHEDNEYTFEALNSIDKRGMPHVDFDLDVGSIVEEAENYRKIPKALPDEFLETLEGYIDCHKFSLNQLADVTTMDADRLKNIRKNKVKYITLEEVLVMGLGLGLQPEEIYDLVDKAPGVKFDRSRRSALIQILLRKLYQFPVTTFNQAMKACGEEPLTYAI